MSDSNIKRASLDDIKRMKANDELYHNPNAPEVESLGADFWEKAEVKEWQRKENSIT